MPVGDRRDAVKRKSGRTTPYRNITVFKTVALWSIVTLRTAEQKHRRKT